MSMDMPKEDMTPLTEPSAEPEAAQDTAEQASPAPANDPFAALADPHVRGAEDVTLSKTRKKKIIILSLIAAFAVLAAVIVLLVFVFPSQPADTDTTVPDTSITVLDKTTTTVSAAVTSAVLQFDDTTVEVINKDDSLSIKGYEKFAVNTTNMDALKNALTLFTATQDIGEQTDLAQYGFTAPTLTGTATYYDKTAYAFELGTIAPDESGYYFHEKGSNHVYILHIDNVAALMQKPLAYISTTVFSTPKTSTSDDNTDVVMRSMSLSGSVRRDRPFSFRLVTSGDGDTYLFYDYVITSPYLKGATSSYTSDLEGFTSLTADSVVCVNPTAADLQTYGLTDPTSVAKFTLAQRTTVTTPTDTNGNSDSTTTYKNLEEHTIRLGRVTNDTYFTMIDDQPIIYAVNASSLPFATLQYDEFADSSLFLEDISDMSIFSVTTPDSSTAFALTHHPDESDNAKNLTVTANGKTYDTMNFRYVVRNFMGISRYDAYTKSVDGLPLKLTLAITHTGQTAPALTIKLYEVSANLYAVVLDNGEKYLVKSSAVINAIEQYHNLLNGKTVLY